jgi:hypothetical protein
LRFGTPRRRLPHRIGRVAHEDIPRLPGGIELAPEAGTRRGVSVGMKVRMKLPCASPESVPDFIDGGKRSHAEMCARFVERHAMAVR